ncbi:MAG TPA: transcription-repair coupling factor, partial [Chthoniobacterales bacterium]|nr:transcription-repair coupling factor [Chthoniobacterales bacterium]
MVYKFSHPDLLSRVTQVPAVKELISLICSNTAATKPFAAPVEFEDRFLIDVTKAAQPFLAASLASLFSSDRSIWFINHEIKVQEEFFNELSEWIQPLELFPDLGMTAEGVGLPDPEVIAGRLALLGRLAQGERLVTVITARELEQQVSIKGDLTKGLWTLSLGWKGSPGEIVGKLEEMGFERNALVASRGEYALRGGVLDLFSWQSDLPYRLEFDEVGIVSMRIFDPDTQLSIQEKSSCEIQGEEKERGTVPFSDYIGSEDLLIILGNDFNEADQALIKKLPGTKIRISDQTFHSHDNEQGSNLAGYDFPCYPIPFASFGAGDFIMQEARRKEFFRQIKQWQEEGNEVVFFSSTEGGGEHFLALAKKENLDDSKLMLLLGEMSEGFFIPGAQLVVLSEAEIFGRSARQQWRQLHRRREDHRAARSAIDYTEFSEGDLVVHAEYGIGCYQGVQRIASGGEEGTLTEMLVLEFQEEAKLFVPLDQAWQVSRYVGVGKATPSLSALGDERWKKIRTTTEKSIFVYAGRLLKLQAERETGLGYAFGPDRPWQKELEDSFPYRETPDQLRAIAEIKQDMEAPQPMDRLLCGDVGFGKTEVALRAAFKALLEGKQVVFLAPTTVLAQQHYQTLRERMSAYPVTIELMSRYRTAAEQREVVKGLAEGSVDLVVGTHRLFSPDIIFKDLGLVIVDEEQRFGVKHKEAFKERFRLIDILTLSATPIPRTLYLSLMGARKMSLLETPPLERQSVETIICAYDERVIRNAIEQELSRGGQVYFLHNRVGTIEKVTARLQELLPQGRFALGHGQMGEGELEEVMQRFIARDIDVLVSTTIIESGLDIPNANTIIIDRADRFGLADLYQLRGRVGRSRQKAYAYLMLPRNLMLFGEARRRVQAIRQYSQLGAGFKIAMRDLEIRGAGNLLGTAQSGHIAAIGFDLYCKMLHKALAQMKGESSKEFSGGEATLLLDFIIHSSSAWALIQEHHPKKEKETDSFRNSTDAANCGVAPVLGASSMLYTLNSCAP